MWLINAHTYALEEFVDETVKPYAILSHRWGDGEVTFRMMRKRLHQAKAMPGFLKIEKICELALIDGLKYAWIDTCCINKDSSAELSEAINSMFRFYQRATFCYVYLFDVLNSNITDLPYDLYYDDSSHQEYDSKILQEFAASSWFTRGWTLQELLAPSNIYFYNHYWHELGDRTTLQNVLSRRTSIPVSVLANPTRSISRYSVAEKMSWAAERVTTRKEDIAYSLMGIFDVNMPLLYGEGPKAFRRLQEEIIRHTDDRSIFTWYLEDRIASGLLAESPAAFRQQHNPTIIRSPSIHEGFSLTNRGILITLSLRPYTVGIYIADVYGWLGVFHKPHLGIFLQKLSEHDQFSRVTVQGQCLINPDEILSQNTGVSSRKTALARSIQVCVPQIPDLSYIQVSDAINGFRLDDKNLPSRIAYGHEVHDIGLAEIYKASTQTALQWIPEDFLITLAPSAQWQNLCTLFYDQTQSLITRIRLGFDFDWKPVVFLAAADGLEDLGYDITETGNGSKAEDRTVNDVRPQSQGIMQRHPDDRLAWSEQLGANLLDLEGRPGLWAWKMHREIKTLFYVRRRNQADSEQAIGCVQFATIKVNEKDVWDFRWHELR